MMEIFEAASQAPIQRLPKGWATQQNDGALGSLLHHTIAELYVTPVVDVQAALTIRLIVRMDAKFWPK